MVPVVLAGATIVCGAALAQSDFVVPGWAFPMNPPSVAVAPPPDDLTLLRVPTSRAAFTQAQVRDLFAPPDWHPDSHPPMPEVVAHGRQPSVYACGYCHLPNGKGRPENAALAGLPAAYIAAQVANFRSGARRSAWSGSYLPNDLMAKVSQNATDAEVVEAADYFSALPMTRRVEVIETEQVPKTHVAGWVYVPDDGGGTEPIGQRIIEVAVDHERHELRDPDAGFRAYVPPGSVARGKDIVTGGGSDLTLPCASCHGATLRGVGLIPPIAGRSPTYILRQLLAFRTGTRSAVAGLPMQAVVARLGIDDMVAISAYVASLDP